MLRHLFLLALFGAAAAALPLAAQTAAGTAGIYPDDAAGTRTDSGEAYDPRALTAAADVRTGVRLLVTNPANGRTVTVRVNDQGPRTGLIVQLSRAAADILGITGPAAVRIRVLLAGEAADPGPPADPAGPPAFVPTPPPSTFFQLGAFRTEGNARSLAKSLLRQGFSPVAKKENGVYRVYLVVPEAEAPALADRLTKANRHGFFQLSKEPGGTLVKLSTE